MVGSQMLRTYGDKPESEDAKLNSTLSNDSTSFQEEARVNMQSSQGKVRVYLTMSAIYLAIFLAALDTVSLPTALPTITVALRASDTGFAWIGATHMLSGATSIAYWGKISDIFGRKWVLLAAKALFIIGSLVSALCDGIGMLFVGRIFQGMAGAGILTVGNRVIDDIFDDQDRKFFLTLSGLVWSLAMAVAPPFGGAFADFIGWRWCFWINVPCTATTFILLCFLLKVDHPRTPIVSGLKAIDWLGTFTLIAGTVFFLLGVEMGGVQFPWDSAATIGLIATGVILFIFFIIIEWKIAPHPLFPLRMFRQRSVSAAFAICATHGMAYQSHLYFIPCYFQAVLGTSPSQSGLWSLIMTGTMALTNGIVGFHLQKPGRSHVIVIRCGAALLTLGLGLFIDFPPHHSWLRIIIFQLVLAVGLGLLFQPPLLALQKALPAASTRPGTTSFLVLRPVSYGISAVTGQLLLQSQMKAVYTEMVNAQIPEWVADTLAFEDTVKGTPLIRRLTGEQQNVVRSAISNGLGKIWIFYTAIAFVGLVAAFCVHDEKPSDGGNDEKEGA